MEDGVTLAVCLEKCGGDVQQAIRAYEKIRFERVCRAQGTGVSTREQWHKADWEKIRKDPESLHLKREAWLLNHDAEMHASEVYAETVASLGQRETKQKIALPDVAVLNCLEASLQQEVDQLA